MSIGPWVVRQERRRGAPKAKSAAHRSNKGIPSNEIVTMKTYWEFGLRAENEIHPLQASQRLLSPPIGANRHPEKLHAEVSLCRLPTARRLKDSLGVTSSTPVEEIDVYDARWQTWANGSTSSVHSTLVMTAVPPATSAHRSNRHRRTRE